VIVKADFMTVHERHAMLVSHLPLIYVTTKQLHYGKAPQTLAREPHAPSTDSPYGFQKGSTRANKV